MNIFASQPSVRERRECLPERPSFCRALLYLAILGTLTTLPDQVALAGTTETDQAKIIELEGKVSIRRGVSPAWDPANTDQPLYPGDQVQTAERSRALVRLTHLSVIRLGPQTTLQMLEKKGAGARLMRGILNFFHRDRPGELNLEGPNFSAVIRGTEFTLEVREDNSAVLYLLDGEVEMSNEFGALGLRSGEAGLVVPGQPPTKTAMIEAVNIVQWCLYYPGIIYPADLGLTEAEKEALRDSLAAYESGNLHAALERYPEGRQPVSAAEKVYWAGLLLAVGQVEPAQSWLDQITAATPPQAPAGRTAHALRQLIAAVKRQSESPAGSGDPGQKTATEWLAESYYRQSRLQLTGALQAARQSVEQGTNFGFGWARVAELEFSFGRIRAAREALERSLALAPQNAQAHALRGFLLSAENRTAAAEAALEEAIRLDGALGNAWLGRGLCRIRRGEVQAGLDDLQVAATAEPQRAVLRSYLGKAYAQARDDLRAAKEWGLAKRMDASDPTPWLYSALHNQQLNQINAALRDLEMSKDLNDNRSVYRSSLLLGQDQATRGANLASVYRDAGLAEIGFQEAAQAVSRDYGNYSAHQFLADSYQALRDPRQISLRYETPWLSEYLVGNLMAPAAAGRLSTQVSQQEYGRLFERNRLGLVSETEYLSLGEWSQMAAQYGIFGGTAYAVEMGYRSGPGTRPNNDFEQLTTSLKVKQELTAQDSLYLQGLFYEAEAGDVGQYYDSYLPPALGGPNLSLRVRETQRPIVLAGYHRQWSPGVHTLILGGRLDDTLRVNNPAQQTLLVGKDAFGNVTGVQPISIEQEYRSDTEIYTLELQQIMQSSANTAIFGGRYQQGDFLTRNQHRNASVFAFLFPNTPQQVRPDMERISVYAYDYLNLGRRLTLAGGISYDRLRYPEDYRYAPLLPGERTREQFSPKAGLVWTPITGMALRGGYSRGLGGVSFDQSFQLEPTQIAGFNQAWRSLIPESVSGANAAARFDNFGLALEQKFRTGTYLAISAELLKSRVARELGVYDLRFPFVVTQGSTPEELTFRERALRLGVYQLLADEWSVGGQYRISQARLSDDFPALPEAMGLPAGFDSRQQLEAVLHQVNLSVNYHHRCGFFGRVESVWNRQSNRGYQPDWPGDDFWQFNAYAGYRFWRRKAELTVGLLNLADQDYRLNPLNLTPEFPRDRTLMLRLRFSF